MYRPRADVLRRMDQEWTALLGDASVRARCRRWAAEAEVLRGCGAPDAVLDRVALAPDVVLGRLLRWHAAGDQLGGRIVLQALLPKLVRMAAVDASAGIGDYLTALWCEIGGYPLDRRPSSIAANLALDTLKSVHRERGRAADVTTAPDVVLASADRRPDRVLGARPTVSGPSVASVLDRARQHRLVDPVTSDLLRSVYADGLTGDAAAQRHGLSPGAVRSRCSRAVRLLARHADLLADPV